MEKWEVKVFNICGVMTKAVIWRVLIQSVVDVLSV